MNFVKNTTKPEHLQDFSDENYWMSLGADATPRKLNDDEIFCARRASDITVKPLQWLWRDVLVQGALNSIQGLAGIGKTYLVCAIVAAISAGGVIQGVSGKMERLKAGTVLYLSGDDDPSMTLVPRLQQLSADLKKIYFAPDGLLPAIGSTMLETLFENSKPSLCVFDTLQHFLPPKTDLNSANATTFALQPLKVLAEKYDTTIVVIQHISKISASGNGGHSVNFGIGSSAVNGLFRSVWTLGRLINNDGTQSDIRVLAPSKTNLVPGDPPSVKFNLSAEAGFEWAGIDHDLTAEQLYQPVRKIRRNAPARSDAENFLKDTLSEKDVLATVVKHEASVAGISFETLKDAKKSLGIESKKRHGVWYWSANNAKPSHTQLDGTLGIVGTLTAQESQECQEFRNL